MNGSSKVLAHIKEESRTVTLQLLSFFLIGEPPTAPCVPVVVAGPAVGGADDAHVEGVGGRAREDDGGPGADGGGGGDRGHGEAGGGLDQAQ